MKIFLNKIYFKLQFSFKKPLVYTNGDYIKQIAQFNQKQLLKNLDLHNFGLKTDQIEIRRKKYGGFLVICVSLFYKVLVQINSVFKFYHKMSNCCISILNGHCSFFCYIFNC